MQSQPKHLLLIIGTAWLFDAMDVALLSFIMPILKAEWHLNDGTLGLVSAITAVGMVAGQQIPNLLYRLLDSGNSLYLPSVADGPPVTAGTVLGKVRGR